MDELYRWSMCANARRLDLPAVYREMSGLPEFDLEMTCLPVFDSVCQIVLCLFEGEYKLYEWEVRWMV